jgi:Replication-relaxation
MQLWLWACVCGGSGVRRVSVAGLVALAEGMPPRDREVVEAVARLTLVSGAQLIDLFFSDIDNPSTRARRARRVLGRLSEQRVLARLERRRGGAGGGSSSWVYALGPAGRRIVAYWSGEGLPRSRSTSEPSLAWAAHRLAVSDLYVRLKRAERQGRAELLAFDAEPAAHRRYTRLGGAPGCLKPDAFVRLGVGEYEDCFFAEVDLGSERRGQLVRQHRAYGEYFRSGVEQANSGVFPAVIWIAPEGQRAALLEDIARGLPEQLQALFTVTTGENALGVFCGDGADAPAQGARS